MSPENPAAKTRMLSSTQAAELLGVSREQLMALCQRAGFPQPFRYVERGKRYFDAAEVLAWKESRRVSQGGADVA